MYITTCKSKPGRSVYDLVYTDRGMAHFTNGGEHWGDSASSLNENVLRTVQLN
jgi:hypothetical protein